MMSGSSVIRTSSASLGWAVCYDFRIICPKSVYNIYTVYIPVCVYIYIYIYIYMWFQDPLSWESVMIGMNSVYHVIRHIVYLYGGLPRGIPLSLQDSVVLLRRGGGSPRGESDQGLYKTLRACYSCNCIHIYICKYIFTFHVTVEVSRMLGSTHLKGSHQEL